MGKYSTVKSKRKLLLSTTAILGSLAIFSAPAMAACPIGNFDQVENTDVGDIIFAGQNTDLAIQIASGGSASLIDVAGTASFTLCIEAGGDVTSAGADPVIELAMDGTTIVSNAGTIIGNVALGDGDSTFIADLDGGTYIMNDTIDGEGGTDDTFRINTSETRAFGYDQTKVVNFENHEILVDGASSELTLTSPATITDGFDVSGGGELINDADFDVTGDDAITLSASHLTNNANIDSSLSGVNVTGAALR
ncbi:MAG: hypothetical protein P8J14_09070 [Emcibacteraceae bacterium]|nr:hypothetical protein [Emcibacteraceae bacterium]